VKEYTVFTKITHSFDLIASWWSDVALFGKDLVVQI